MSILTDTDLTKILCYDEAQWDEDKTLLIQHGSDDCLTPMGYDLSVGSFYKTFIAKPNLVTIKKGGKVAIKPGDIALIGSLEKLKMPKDGSISALILSRVSQVSRGISNISTKVDPGWAEGELLIPVQNFSRDVIELDYAEKFCTIVFFKNESPASPYNSRSSREKFFNLLAKTNSESLAKDFQLAAVSIFIYGISIAIGYNLYGDKPTFGVIVGVGIAIEKIVSPIAARIIGRR